MFLQDSEREFYDAETIYEAYEKVQDLVHINLYELSMFHIKQRSLNLTPFVCVS
jgi:hypothetical protein